MTPVQELPVIFKSQGHQIMGVHHTSGQQRSLLLCHGLTGDKVEDHRLFVHTARAFSEENYDVLRYDFYGSGDSEGDFRQTRLSHNIDNIRDAVSFLRNIKYKQIAVLGMSLGAAAAILCANELPIDALILWSPVTDTRKLLTERMHVDPETTIENRIISFDHWELEADFVPDVLKYDIKSAFSELNLSTFVAQGMQDAPMFVQGFHALRQIAKPPCDFMELPQAIHTFSIPRHRHQVIRQSLIWLDRQLTKG
ncbi:MAG: alpha/beta fold hydrolase [candidate division KSB1 bacterium]|nr:alpha/beta fold hydrolase [candidate division KSB1 bacterium]